MINKKPNAQHGYFPKITILNIRLTHGQKIELYMIAKAQNLTMSAYVIQALGLGVHVEHVEHVDHSE